MRQLLIFAALLVAAIATAAQDLPESWIDSPEAYFATAKERTEWARLENREEREAFKSRYWLLRDPSPGTAENEFRTVVRERIKNADARFTNNDVPGSFTDQGMVFIVFGSPARVGTATQKPLPAANSGGPGEPPGGRGPLGWVEGFETTTTWTWDRDRAPRILEVVKLPSFDLTFVTEPNKRVIKLQNPGKANDLRILVADASIVNPDLRGADAVAATSAIPISLAELSSPAALGAQTLAALRGAPRQTWDSNGASFGHAIIIRDGGAVPIVWAWLPDALATDASLRLQGLVSGIDGEIGRFARPFAQSLPSVAIQGGKMAAVQLPLEAGEWTVSLAIERGGKMLASSTIPVKVPDAAAPWSTSSLILSASPSPSDSADTFTLGGVQIPPRADATFLTSESLWYFFEVKNVPSPETAWIEMRLRKDGQPFGTAVARTADLGPVEPGVWMGGFEMPLATLADGVYTIYLGLKDDPKAEDARAWLRGDFRVVTR